MAIDGEKTTRNIRVLILLMFALSSCATPTSTPISLPEPAERPVFIERVCPRESSLIPMELYAASYYDTLGCRRAEDGYASSICVSFSLTTLVQRGDELVTDDQIFERIELHVDDLKSLGKPYSNLSGGVLGFEGQIGSPHTRWSGPNASCWKVPLGVGLHKVSFVFRQTSGVIKSYTWYFAIADS